MTREFLVISMTTAVFVHPEYESGQEKVNNVAVVYVRYKKSRFGQMQN